METFERVSEVIGPVAALRLLCFFAGRKALYIPEKATANHLIARLVGPEKFADMVVALGGQTISIPNLDMEPVRRAGIVLESVQRGLPYSVIALATGVSKARVCQIVKELEGRDYSKFDPKGGPSGRLSDS